MHFKENFNIKPNKTKHVVSTVKMEGLTLFKRMEKTKHGLIHENDDNDKITGKTYILNLYL
jgi:hypothetical protein